jgi:F-type H+-transporting ATPase subunit delta
MKEKIVIARYAEAFIAHAHRSIGMHECLDNCRQMKSIVRDNPEFLEFLKNPEITHEEKHSFIDKVLSGSLPDEGRNFIKLLFDKGRISLLEDVIEYIRVRYAHEGELEVLLRAASLHDMELIKSLEEVLKKKFGPRLKFYLELDGRILGGIQVVIGNTIIDGSVRRRLDELRTKLQQVRV